jgi:hypothetical protein
MDWKAQLFSRAAALRALPRACLKAAEGEGTCEPWSGHALLARQLLCRAFSDKW